MKKVRSILLKIAGVILVFVLAFFLAQLAKDNVAIQEFVASFSYVGVFILSIISGFNLIVPIPAVSFLPLFLESGLDVWITLLVMSLGMTLADSVTYWLGYWGREYAHVAHHNKVVVYLDSLRERYYWAPLILLFFFASFAPLPNEVLVIPLGFMGYKLKHLIPIVLVGNIIFNSITALGVVRIFNVF